MNYLRFRKLTFEVKLVLKLEKFSVPVFSLNRKEQNRTTHQFWWWAYYLESMDNISLSSLANGLQMGLIQLEFEWDTHLRGANSPTINACNCANIDLWHTNIENSSLLVVAAFDVYQFIFFYCCGGFVGGCVCLCLYWCLSFEPSERGKREKP